VAKELGLACSGLVYRPEPPQSMWRPSTMQAPDGQWPMPLQPAGQSASSHLPHSAHSAFAPLEAASASHY
jgi:hypothetical protein